MELWRIILSIEIFSILEIFYWEEITDYRKEGNVRSEQPLQSWLVESDPSSSPQAEWVSGVVRDQGHEVTKLRTAASQHELSGLSADLEVEETWGWPHREDEALAKPLRLRVPDEEAARQLGVEDVLGQPPRDPPVVDEGPVLTRTSSRPARVVIGVSLPLHRSFFIEQYLRRKNIFFLVPPVFVIIEAF